MTDLTRGRMLLAGLGASLAIVGLMAAGARLTGWYDWRSMSIVGLLLLGLVISAQMVRPGSHSPGFGRGQQMYIEAVAREASQQPMSEYRPSSIHPIWFWTLVPLIVILLIVALAF